MKSIIDAIDNFAVHEKSKKVHDAKSDSFTLDNYFRTFSADSLREKCPNKEVFLVRIWTLFTLTQRRVSCPDTICSTIKLTEQNLKKLNDQANKNSW